MIESQIKTLQDQIDGLLVDRGRIIDNLLDLRLDAADRADFVGKIDEVLRDVPGLTVVESQWWTETLDELLDMAAKVPAAK